MRSLLREEFRLPLAVCLLLFLGFVPSLSVLWIGAIGIGIVKIASDSFGKIREGIYSLDYIAFLAMVVSLPSAAYLAGAVVALMITGGEALDDYASRHAEGTLRALAERIPKRCIVRGPQSAMLDKPIQEVLVGDVIVVRSGELVPLDGSLVSDEALLNEANLTGEALPVPFQRSAFIKSGAVNIGSAIEIKVERAFEHSTYMHIVNLVAEAKRHQPRTVRLAEQVNFPFTAAALILAGGAFALSGDLSRALAVLVIATPCPLLIAAPVAFIGGLSRAARKNVIVKRPSTLEQITRTRAIYFDKTGTLTLGEPALVRIEPFADTAENDLLAIASAIEFHSIHPLARATTQAAKLRGVEILRSEHVAETIGKGIEGDVRGTRYLIAKSTSFDSAGITLSLSSEERELGRLHFEDVIKPQAAGVLQALKAEGLQVEILTGDRKANATRLFGAFGVPIQADLTPERKFEIIEASQKRGAAVMMVGDGLNDAPALAKADVGVVFSGTENSAAIEAADVAILGHDVELLNYLLGTARRSMNIARQSIFGGVLLSVAGMVLASAGLIPPVIGAILQEVIDVVVILNSVRAAAD